MALSFVQYFCLTYPMIRLAITICLTLMTLLVSASVSLAAECADDPNECTPKKLCETATNIVANNTVWSTRSSNTTHVEFAQNLGMTCGVIAALDPCDSDPNECKISQLCGKATTESAGQISWDDSAEAYVALAKDYGLSCDVEAESTFVNKTCSASSPEVCADLAICVGATYGYGKTLQPVYAKEAKKRGLSCEMSLDFRAAFTSQPKLKRQQIQYALKKLGYYSYGIDGGWGKGTSTGIDKFVSTSNLQGKTEAQIFKTLLSRVSVPSSFEKKSTSTTVVTSNSNNNQNRNKRFDCDRTSLPTMGFANRTAAESWYPAEIWLVIAADKSWMASWYGTKKERSQWDQKNNHLNIPEQGVVVKINGSALSDQKESTVWVNLIVTGNFKQLGGASYKCGKAKATSWEPD
jgi:hypothetical protein